MKWLFGAVIFVGAIWILASSQEEDPISPVATIMSSHSGDLTLDHGAADSGHPSAEVEAEQSEAVSRVADEAATDIDEDGVVNIGEPLDPDDFSSWVADDNAEVVNIGEPMDPDDPSSWPAAENTEVINIGEEMNPDDPSTWLVDENAEVSNIGDPMDPDDPLTWTSPESTERINIGEPIDPDSLYNYPRDTR